ncbi:hypothetical protein F5Y12DRAFT_169830 [Xylaria sp. FL1777]|nr:hypothetical protein F5Y12DRAFT_169830 [Xylaria sp. FL1777]
MGNTPSVEAAGKGSRTTQRLSKPRTGNPATAGLLNPTGVSDIIRRPPSTAGRRLSLPYSSTSVPSPRHFEPENAAVDDLVAPHGASPLVEDFSSCSLFQRDSQGALCQGAHGVGVVASSSRGRRMSRTSSGYMGVDEGYEQAQLGLAALPRTTSLVNYDLSSYEAKRLLSLVEAPPFEDQLIASESQVQEALSRRQSYTPSYHPGHSESAVPLPRTNSDASLYTPMRRRSLLTPGVATRPAPPDLIIPLDMKTGPSPHPTPLFSDSLETMGGGVLSFPHSSFDPSLIARAHTPCETDYKQTGAFKHGTLRITNGSPARTPAQETIDDSLFDNSPSTTMGQSSYFGVGSQVQDGQNKDSDNRQYPAPPVLAAAPSPTSASNLATGTGEHEMAINFLPELKLTLSPFSIGEIQSGVPELQTTSKHTAAEDQLFEDECPEYSTEVLNVRVDHDAKHSSFPPSEPLEGKRKDISRSDSGVVASPISDAPQKSLSKADSGYSSSVSIRSSSSGRKGRGGVGYSRNLEAVSPRAPTFEHAKLLGNVSMTSRSDTVDPRDGQRRSSSADGPPPQVPEKDDHIKVPKQVTAPPNDSSVSAKKPSLPSNRPLVSETPKHSHHLAPSPDNSIPISSLSISNARQPGRLQRILSGARAPLTVHITHALDREVGVPPVPRGVREKLHERAGLSSISLENSLNSTDISKDNSKSTAVNTSSMNHDPNSAIRALQDHGSSARTDQDKTRGFKSSFHIHSIGSTITRAASSVMARNPILRKPASTRTKPDDADVTFIASDTPDTTTKDRSGTSSWHRKGVENINSVFLSPTDARDRYDESTVATGRSNSLSPSIDFDSKTYNDARRSSLASQSERYAVAFRKPSSPGQYSVSKTPPPISMKTRNTGQLRVPQLIRPRSTPPSRSAVPTLSRKSSREGVQSYPPYKYPMNSNHVALSQQSTQESFYKHSAAQIQDFLNQPSQMPTTTPWRVQANLGEYQVSGGITNPKHGRAPSWDSSYDHSRHNSLASQASHRSHRSAFSNGQPWPHYSPYDNPTLKHRSSYDGYSFQIRQGYEQQNGPYPPLPRMNGQAYMSDYLNGRSMLHQSRQYQQYAQYASRGHLRHHSLDHNGFPVPYRVLHSYNSPAYRGVPIWSA